MGVRKNNRETPPYSFGGAALTKKGAPPAFQPLSQTCGPFA